MFPASSFLRLPAAPKPLSSAFLHGSPPPLPFKAPPAPPSRPSAPLPLAVRAMRNLQGRVVCTTNDKTVAVEVTRLAPHPKYKRRVRKKKTYQAHDPDNRFQVGDVVQLQKSRPISKTKAFLAIPAPPRNAPKPPSEGPGDLALESQMQ